MSPRREAAQEHYDEGSGPRGYYCAEEAVYPRRGFWHGWKSFFDRRRRRLRQAPLGRQLSARNMVRFGHLAARFGARSPVGEASGTGRRPCLGAKAAAEALAGAVRQAGHLHQYAHRAEHSPTHGKAQERRVWPVGTASKKAQERLNRGEAHPAVGGAIHEATALHSLCCCRSLLGHFEQGRRNGRRLTAHDLDRDVAGDPDGLVELIHDDRVQHEPHAAWPIRPRRSRQTAAAGHDSAASGLRPRPWSSGGRFQVHCRRHRARGAAAGDVPLRERGRLTQAVCGGGASSATADCHDLVGGDLK